MTVVIIGAGKLGYRLANIFSIKDNNVSVVDNDDEALYKARADIDMMPMHADGLNIEMLTRLNIAVTDILFAVTGSDETNLLIATLAKKMGCKRVVARVRNPNYSSQIDFIKHNLDIDLITNQDYETATEIAKMLLKSEAIYMDDFANGKVGMSEFMIESEYLLNGKTIKSINLPKRILIVAIKRNEEMLIPNGDTVLFSGDLLYIIGVKLDIQNFLKQYNEQLMKPDYKRIKRVMILGGGNISYYLTKRLEQKNVQVKIIEKNKEICKELAIDLPNALIIHGDATDLSILIEENIAHMDAVVTLTGFDEENILLSVVAKKYKVPKVITKVSKSNYVSVLHDLDINLVINPVLLTASHLMRYAQGGRIKSLSLLLGGSAEVMEIIALEGTRIVGRPLSAIELPRGIIIGAVVKNGKVIVPDGTTMIEPHNRVIVFCLNDVIDKIEAYFYKGKRGILNELWNDR